MASARQWFLEGASIDDVMTMLADRRRFELPADDHPLCGDRNLLRASRAKHGGKPDQR